jgi:hypothetical protein
MRRPDPLTPAVDRREILRRMSGLSTKPPGWSLAAYLVRDHPVNGNPHVVFVNVPLVVGN